MKLETPNLVASCATMPIWVIAYTISYAATVRDENNTLLAVAGMMIFILWGINIIGSLIGIVSICFNWKSLQAWFGAGIHFLQFFITFFVTFLGFFLHFE